ncbi:MAG: molybdopterin-guanine dinucleotide biosynthesis protein B [Hyphomicrobiales bacterium]|nr:MAG: molybdopterin-guanine dinucleotide biosynthesis protein B [Hyphomicrobiales bacterium]
MTTPLPFPVFGVAGFKNSGKTTLVTRIVQELSDRGYAVSTIKHAHHGFDLDKPGRDSFLHRNAGAQEVAIISNSRWALMRELRGAEEPVFRDVLSKLSPCDVVIVEGYKMEDHPKIELRLAGSERRPLAPEDPTIVAIASDEPISDEHLPCFERNRVRDIADFIVTHLELGAPGS